MVRFSDRHSNNPLPPDGDGSFIANALSDAEWRAFCICPVPGSCYPLMNIRYANHDGALLAEFRSLQQRGAVEQRQVEINGVPMPVRALDQYFGVPIDYLDLGGRLQLRKMEEGLLEYQRARLETCFQNVDATPIAGDWELRGEQFVSQSLEVSEKLDRGQACALSFTLGQLVDPSQLSIFRDEGSSYFEVSHSSQGLLLRGTSRSLLVETAPGQCIVDDEEVVTSVRAIVERQNSEKQKQLLRQRALNRIRDTLTAADLVGWNIEETSLLGFPRKIFSHTSSKHYHHELKIYPPLLLKPPQGTYFDPVDNKEVVLPSDLQELVKVKYQQLRARSASLVSTSTAF